MFPTAILVQYGTTFDVSTPTPLHPGLSIEPYPTIEIVAKNPDLVNELTLYADPGSQGSFDANSRQFAIGPPGGCAILTITGAIWEQIRIGAMTDSPSYPAIDGVTYQVRGRRRGRDPY